MKQKSGIKQLPTVSTMKIERGSIVLVSLDPTIGVEIQKTRPCIVVSSDLGNMYSNMVTILPITSKRLDHIKKFEVLLEQAPGLTVRSKVLADQIRSVDKRRVQKILGKLPRNLIDACDRALKYHLGYLEES
jgi:mRNA interferase MazF